MTEQPSSSSTPRERLATLREIERDARERLGPEVWEELEAGVGDEWTLRRNRSVFDRWQLRPRALSGVSTPTLATSFCGIPLAHPVVAAPFSDDARYHEQGHLALVRGCRIADAAAIVAADSSRRLEDVAEAAEGISLLLQLDAAGPHDLMGPLASRAEAAGYRGLVVSVAVAVAGPEPVGWRWGDVTRALHGVRLPWIAKGVLTADDALAAVAAGAAGLIVSNHGGRGLDRVPGALDALVEVVAAVGPVAEVMVDGGFRRGSDVAIALALGARAVGVGRPAIWGLAADGADGVARVMTLLRDELAHTVAWLGRPSVAALDRSAVAPVGWRSGGGPG